MHGDNTHAHAYKLQDNHYLRGGSKGKCMRVELKLNLSEI